MQEKPQVSELLQKLCSWAVITMLDFHPRRASMPTTLVYKVAGNSSYQVEADSADAGTLEELLEMTRSQLVRIGEDAAVEGRDLAAAEVLAQRFRERGISGRRRGQLGRCGPLFQRFPVFLLGIHPVHGAG